MAKTKEAKKKLVVPLHKRPGTPYFMVPGMGGHIFAAQRLAKNVPEPWAGYGVLYPAFLEDEEPTNTMTATAKRMVPDILESQPYGPYLLVGYSIGGLVCLEIARELRAMGKTVSLVLIDVKLIQYAPLKPWYQRLPTRLYWQGKASLQRWFGDTTANKRRAIERDLNHIPRKGGPALPAPFARAYAQGKAALDSYNQTPCDIPAVLIHCEKFTWWDDLRLWPTDYGWSKYVNLKPIVYTAGDHTGLMRTEQLPSLGRSLDTAFTMLSEEQGAPGSQRPSHIQSPISE